MDNELLERMGRVERATSEVRSIAYLTLFMLTVLAAVAIGLALRVLGIRLF